MRDKVVFKEPSVLKYCIDNYKIEEMCYKAVGAFLTTVNFVPDWFATNKMLEKLDDVVFFEDDKVFVNEESDNVTLVMIWILLIQILIILAFMNTCARVSLLIKPVTLLKERLWHKCDVDFYDDDDNDNDDGDPETIIYVSVTECNR